MNMVSLFPAENGVEGGISPFRSDLLTLMKGLHPRCPRNATALEAFIIHVARDELVTCTVDVALPAPLPHVLSPSPESHYLWQA